MKTKSKQDNVWISFYEGLHRHASLLITLLAAAFDIILSRTFLMLEAAIAALSRSGGDDVDDSECGVRRCSEGSSK